MGWNKRKSRIVKKVGIVTDNYKLEKYKTDLIAKGFIDFKIVPFTENTSVMQVMAKESEIKEIHKICQLAELHFKRAN